MVELPVEVYAHVWSFLVDYTVLSTCLDDDAEELKLSAVEVKDTIASFRLVNKSTKQAFDEVLQGWSQMAWAFFFQRIIIVMRNCVREMQMPLLPSYLPLGHPDLVEREQTVSRLNEKIAYYETLHDKLKHIVIPKLKRLAKKYSRKED